MDINRVPAHNYYEDFLIYNGAHHAVYFHAEAEDSSIVYGYFEACDEVTQAGLLFLVRRMAETGRIYNTTKFRIEDRKHKIYCFKPRKERFFCFFFMDKKIIITSAYRKKGKK